MPESTENFHWIPVRDAGLFVQDSFRQITLSEEQGIHARIGKLKNDPQGGTVIQSYYFDKYKFSMEEAQKWVKDHKKSARDIERRCTEHTVTMRFDSGQPPRMVGYAAVFNKRTTLWDGFDEQVAPGAFASAIKSSDVYALWNHNASDVLGNTGSGTLFLSEDDTGLRYEVIPPDTNLGRDLQVLIKRGDIRKSSFGFSIVDEDIQHEGRKIIRTIKDVKLFDVSPVTYPAYKETTVNVRMIAGENESFLYYEDSGKLIVVPEETAPPSPQSDDELFRLIDQVKEKVFG